MIDLSQLLIFFVINLFFLLGLLKHLMENLLINFRNGGFQNLFLFLKLFNFSFCLFLDFSLFLLQFNLFLNKFLHVCLFNFLRFELLLNLLSILFNFLIFLHSFFKFLLCFLLFFSNFLEFIFIFSNNWVIILKLRLQSFYLLFILYILLFYFFYQIFLHRLSLLDCLL